MIKIINGTYGTSRLNSKSAPFALSEKEEARLVALGVAEYVDAPEAPATTEAPEQGEGESTAPEMQGTGENPGTDENGEQGENPAAGENGEQGENPAADNQDAGEDKAPAETVKPEAEKQTKTTKGKKAAKK